MPAAITTLRIERLVHRGMGLGRVEGRVWMVPFSAPGDLLEVVAARETPGFVEGRILRVLQPGPDRREPPCPWHGTCGGCHLQHLRDDRQAHWKAQVLRDVLGRIGGIEAFDPLVQEGRPWRWRGRIQVHGEGRFGDRRFGFYRQRSRDLVEIGDCLIACEALGAILPRLSGALRRWPGQGPDTLELVQGQDGQVVIVAKGLTGPATILAEHLLDLPGVRGVLVQEGRSWVTRGDCAVEIPTDDGQGGEVLLPSDPRGFSQAHLDLNPRMARRVRELAEAAPGLSVLELYAGSGNLTWPLARAGATVTALEVNDKAVAQARRQMSGLGDRVRLLSLPAEALPHRPDLWQGREVLVMDPPRSGLGLPLARALATLPFRHIVWVACDPAPLARDLRPFLEGPFQLETLEAWDLFPQTFHLETLVRLKRVSVERRPPRAPHPLPRAAGDGQTTAVDFPSSGGIIPPSASPRRRG